MSEPTGRAEQVFYDADGVRVTSARFQVGAQTYAMSAVNSVAYQKTSPPAGLSTALVTVGALFAIASALGVVSRPTISGPWIFLFFGFFLLFMGIALRRGHEPDFIVALTTASGQVQALRSKDQKYIESVVMALNEALVSRG